MFKIAEQLGASERTIERWHASPEAIDGRKGAPKVTANALTKAEKANMLEVANSAPYRNLPPSQFVPLLADKGQYIASESSFYRLLNATRQMTHRQKSSVRIHKRPDCLTATGVNQVWTWDITYLKTEVRGIYFYLYMHVDIFSRKIVGWVVHENECAQKASELFSSICKKEKVLPFTMSLHSDNGSPMKGSTMLSTLQYLGVMPSFSRPSVSDDNPFSEALFKTLKYHQSYPDGPFKSLADANEWVETFVAWYNEEHLHSGINFVTPSSRHEQKDIAILEKRKEVYEAAKKKKPNRWSKKTRAWQQQKEVVLNSRKADSYEIKSA